MTYAQDPKDNPFLDFFTISHLDHLDIQYQPIRLLLRSR